jgi:2-(1,2-epoxy-1,2-dihydrophenyl)acetyl-CoA isomerase
VAEEPTASDTPDRPLHQETDSRASDDLITRIDGQVLVVTLNRPEAANALTPDQRNRLIALLDQASRRVEIRAVVLTGEGKHFFTGADLRAGEARGAADGPADLESTRPEEAPDRVTGDVARLLQDGAQRLVSSVMDCSKPVVAAVNGTAAGLGAQLALSCDLVLAADGARFIEVFVRRGLVPDAGGAWLLPRLIGLQRAKELMFFGDAVPAAEAERMGLVNRVVPPDELAKVAGEWAQRLAEGPTPALALMKELLNRSLDSDRATALRDEAVAQERNMASHDAQEGVRAFVERRDPTFKGW